MPTDPEPRCDKRNADGRRCEMYRHHPSYCAAKAAGRWIEWYPPVRVSAGTSAELEGGQR